jgi:hypothetical protein
MIRLHPPAIYPYFTGTQHTINTAPWHTLKKACQEIINAPAGLIGSNPDLANSHRFDAAIHAAFTLLLLQLLLNSNIDILFFITVMRSFLCF